MPISDETPPFPLSFRPSRSTMIISSGAIAPLRTPVGEARIRCASSRTEMFPSVAGDVAAFKNPAARRRKYRAGAPLLFSAFRVKSHRLTSPPPCSVRPLCVKSPQLQRPRHAVNCQNISGDPVIDPMRFSVAYHFIEALFHHILQPLVHFAFAPERSPGGPAPTRNSSPSHRPHSREYPE